MTLFRADFTQGPNRFCLCLARDILLRWHHLCVQPWASFCLSAEVMLSQTLCFESSPAEIPMALGTRHSPRDAYTTWLFRRFLHSCGPFSRQILGI
ncbi:hypothetical protein SCLCIDRAFT_434604 [Scleroderma citrinum Foug A]|uniref:Uncharacterized protein n=1 Tax=Scleroderma citrinum Foug A TaxID=1036808 RepID=A0A0C2YV59_9AGAM|nr:hypothetical protein SCLCIDRAFT_434604 [Scleroderma citrinum Foug A]